MSATKTDQGQQQNKQDAQHQNRQDPQHQNKQDPQHRQDSSQEQKGSHNPGNNPGNQGQNQNREEEQRGQKQERPEHANRYLVPEQLSALPSAWTGGFPFLDLYFASQGVGSHLEPSFSILKCVLVTKSWYRFAGSCTMVVMMSQESPLGSLVRS